MRVYELVQHGIRKLKDAGVSEPETDCCLLLGSVLDKTRTELFLAADMQVDSAREKTFLEYLARRIKREPTAYIVGEKEFWSLTFSVSPDVLIPRPETEFLLETVFKKVHRSGLVPGVIGDICCGSGVIGIILALELKKKIIGIDISSKALEVAVQNSLSHKVTKLLSFIRGDLLTGFRTQPFFSLAVANPPYISHHELVNSLEPEVARYEPYLALDGGERGMEQIKRLRTQVAARLLPGGYFFMEIGYDQGEEVRELFSVSYKGSRPFDSVEVIRDYSGRDRVLYGTLSGV